MILAQMEGDVGQAPSVLPVSEMELNECIV